MALYTNSLGMVFVPVSGTEVKFCQCETRVQDFEAFVAATRYNATNDVFSPGDDGWKRRGWNWSNPGFAQGPIHPVAGVSWHDAKGFCRWLTATERRAGLLTDRQRYRLPTDLEWSIAAGLPLEKGRTPELRSRQIVGVYLWGTSWPPAPLAGNYSGLESGLIHCIDGFQDPFARTAPVASFPPSAAGLYDLGGNVWEWCEDWFDSDERYKVMRGGSWFSSGADTLLASHRDKDPPGLRNLNIGFRVVLVTNE